MRMWKEHKKIMHLCGGSNCYTIRHPYFGHVSIGADLFVLFVEVVYDCPYLLQLFMNVILCCLYIAWLMAYTAVNTNSFFQSFDRNFFFL